MFGLFRKDMDSAIGEGVASGVKTGLDAAMPRIVDTVIDQYLEGICADLRQNGRMPKQLTAALMDYLKSAGLKIVRIDPPACPAPAPARGETTDG